MAHRASYAVVIKELLFSCGCLTAKLSAWTIEAGSSVNVVVEVDGTGFEGRVPEGIVGQDIGSKQIADSNIA